MLLPKMPSADTVLVVSFRSTRSQSGPSDELVSVPSGTGAAGSVAVARLLFASAAAAACNPRCMSFVDGGALYAFGAIAMFTVVPDGSGGEVPGMVPSGGALVGARGAALKTG